MKDYGNILEDMNVSLKNHIFDQCNAGDLLLKSPYSKRREVPCLPPTTPLVGVRNRDRIPSVFSLMASLEFSGCCNN